MARLFLKSNHVARLLAAVTALIFVAPASAGEIYDPTGYWLTSKKNIRWEIYLCGESGTKLCGRLDWAKANVMKGRVGELITRDIRYDLNWRGNNVWRGHVKAGKDRVAGSVRLLSANRMKVTGCVFYVICGDVNLKRVPAPEIAEAEAKPGADATSKPATQATK